MKKAQQVTKAIRNLDIILIMNTLSLNKISGELKINCFKNPNYA